MPNGWEALVGEIVNKYDKKTSSHSAKNVCKFGAIYSLEGVCYAAHPASWSLTKYETDVMQEDGSTKKMPIDEMKCAVQASKGDRSGGSGGAGIRMGGKVRPHETQR